MNGYVKKSDIRNALFEYKDRDGKIRTLPNRDCDNRPITLSVEEIKKAIAKIPTADVVPVVYAHWIPIKRRMYACNDKVGEICTVGYTCSKCGEEAEIEYPYSHCGAKMDEKENKQ